jgi:hypothetical protein
LCALSLLALAACDIPTAAPKLQQTWAVPVSSNRIAVSDLLPASVHVAQGAFRVPLQPASTALRLQEICGPNCAVPGLQVPKPAFMVEIPLSVVRPTDFARAILAGGDTIHVTLAHNFGFPVLMPAGAQSPGSLSVQLIVGTDTLRATRSGTTHPWPSGATLDLPLAIPSGAMLSANVELLLTVESPAGDAVTMNGTTQLTASVQVGTVGITAVSAPVPSVQLASQTVELDLSQFDADVASRARSAELTLAIANPLDVEGTFTLAFNGGQGSLIAPRSIGIRAGSSTVAITLSRSELDQLLGRHVSLNLTGKVAATKSDGIVTIRPTDAITVDARLALSVVLP